MLSVYVTGTDTGIGKTYAAVALLHQLRSQGLRAIGMKPVASGCELVDDVWRNADALALLEASSGTPDYALVNPVALPEADAPELAARAAGTKVSLAPLCSAYAELAANCDAMVVEGVGGWASPLSASLYQSTLVHALDLPVVLVVGLRLGRINHARLSAQAISADGCRLLGWIGNRIDPDFSSANATRLILQRELKAPCLGVFDHAKLPLTGSAAPTLDLGPLQLST